MEMNLIVPATTWNSINFVCEVSDKMIEKKKVKIV